MKALIQRVAGAEVAVKDVTTGKIGKGLLILLCAVKGDTDKDRDYLVRKVSGLRIFDDKDGKMNLSILDVQGEALIISQFTLAARTRKGTRPSFDDAEVPEKAERLYEGFVRRLRDLNIRVETGMFGKYMSVSLINDGPVTIMIDTHEKKE